MRSFGITGGPLIGFAAAEKDMDAKQMLSYLVSCIAAGCSKVRGRIVVTNVLEGRRNNQ